MTTLGYLAGTDMVSSVTDPVTGAVGYTYGLAGQRLTMILPGGNTWTYDYTSHTGQSSTVVPKDDPNAICKNLSKITDDQGRQVDYYVSETGQMEESLTDETYSGSSLSQYLFTKYTYDTYHGTLTRIANQWKKMMFGFWQTTTLAQNDYTYDESSMRLTNQISNSAGVVRTETYGYDELYRLTSVNYGDSHSQSYTFDPMGNRLTKVNDGVSEGYSYNPANTLCANMI